jgi:hypothetical protein
MGNELELFGYIISGIVSVSTAIIILRLQSWFSKKQAFKALYGEIESNLSLAQKVLPLAIYFSKKDKREEYTSSTYFDLKPLYTYCYEDFRRSGYVSSLNQNARELLQEVYELITSHNYQTEILRSQKILESIFPRIGGYSERLEILIDKLKLLREQLRKSYSRAKRTD